MYVYACIYENFSSCFPKWLNNFAYKPTMNDSSSCLICLRTRGPGTEIFAHGNATDTKSLEWQHNLTLITRQEHCLLLHPLRTPMQAQGALLHRRAGSTGSSPSYLEVPSSLHSTYKALPGAYSKTSSKKIKYC